MIDDIIHGDCLEVMRGMEPESVDAIVTDPPYGLEFMGKDWDHGIPGVPFWEAALRVAKPGVHLLAFGGTRTHHRLMCAIEDAGWEIRDCLMWVYGSGFPKSLDVGKAIDRQRDDYEARCRVALWLRPYVEAVGFAKVSEAFGFKDQTMARARWTSRSQPNTPTLEQWVKLKSVCDLPGDMDSEVWRLNGRKGQPGPHWWKREVVGVRDVPEGYAFAGPTYGGDSSNVEMSITTPATEAAKQWDGWGTALKPAWEPIILARKPLTGTVAANVLEHGTGGLNIDGCRVGGGDPRRIDNYPSVGNHGCISRTGEGSHAGEQYETRLTTQGRWPANVVHDGSEEVVGLFPTTKSGEMKAGTRRAAQDEPGSVCYGTYGGNATDADTYGDVGSAARFFYCAKASRSERDEGNTHPTVKPIALMRWLCRLVTPPNGLILDPFCGSGSTGVAASLEAFRFVGIDDKADYCEIARQRIAAASEQLVMELGS